MNKNFSRSISLFLSISIFLGNVSLASAQAIPNLCSTSGVTFGFFNGVNTTSREAEVARNYLELSYGSSTSSGELIQYEVFYNTTNGLVDFVETFDQRLLEQNGLLAGRFELFFESLNGGGTFWNQITSTVASANGILDGIFDLFKARTISNLALLVSKFTTAPPTSLNYQEHRVRIDNSALSGKKMLFYAHSQGNLFANVAYDYALTKVSASNVKLIHVAPASPNTGRGSHTLADLDLVINGLRVTGTVASITDSIFGILLRLVGLNGKKDALGHGLLEIYINLQNTTAARIKSHVQVALSTLVAPPARAADGIFTATLTWDGTGDVDLHTFEPGGAHVYYAASRGAAGFLDVDNVVANGPEHYYASCSASSLQTGTYKIAVANYSRATGRTAVVQIASRASGVLDTRSVLLGAETGDTPSTTLFSVVVARDQTSGAVTIGLAP